MGCEESKLVNYPIPIQKESLLEKKKFTFAYRQFVANTPGNVFQLYHFSTVISKSPIKLIRKVTHKTHGTQRICKVVPFQKINHLLLMMEVETLKNLEHPNIIQIYQYFIEKLYLFIIYENFEGKSLFEELSSFKEISHCQIIDLIYQLLLAVAYCHQADIAHRNINPSNILVKIQEDEIFIKLIGFSGTSKIRNPNKKSVRSQIQQIPEFKAYFHEQAKTHAAEHDIYCCGLLLLSILSKNKVILEKRQDNTEVIFDFMSKNPQYLIFQDLLLGLLHHDPSKRLIASSALENFLFEKNSNFKSSKIIYDNLLQYKIKGRLKEVLWMYATINAKDYITPQLVTEFHNLDTNKDGKIDLGQLAQGIANTYSLDKVTALQHAQMIFSKLDKNMNGYLDFYEFVMGSRKMSQKLSEKQLQTLFKQLDRNNDGIISSKELNSCIEGIEEFYLLQVHLENINFSEFKGIMKNYAHRLSQTQKIII